MPENSQKHMISKPPRKGPMLGDSIFSPNDPKKPNFDPAKKPFVISIPPPNITGGLHLGHAMFVAIEDLMIRYHRMLGESALWVPGSDHAGIATQLQIEKALKEEGLTREDIGRDAFIKRTWAWKEKYGGSSRNRYGGSARPAIDSERLLWMA
jgi:valyl-tRNA synthetase